MDTSGRGHVQCLSSPFARAIVRRVRFTDTDVAPERGLSLFATLYSHEEDGERVRGRAFALALFQNMLDGDCKTVYTSHRSKLQSWACLTSTMISDTSYKHASSRTRHKSFLAAYSQRTCRVRAPYLQLSEKRACSVPSSPSSDSSSSSFSSPFLHSLRGSSVVFLLHTCSVPAAYLQRTCSVERSSLLEF